MRDRRFRRLLLKADLGRASAYPMLCDTPSGIYDVAVYRNSIHSGTDVG